MSTLPPINQNITSNNSNNNDPMKNDGNIISTNMNNTTESTANTEEKTRKISISQQFFKVLPVKTCAEAANSIRTTLLPRKNDANTPSNSSTPSPSDEAFPDSDIPRVKDKIGSGNCGTVVTVCERGEITAVKVPLNPLEARQMHGIVKTLSTKPGGDVFPKVYPNIMTTAGPGLRMKYFEGGKDLDDYLQTLRAENQLDLLERQTRQLLKEVLQGVSMLHEAGYVHGSLKPGNIMVVPNLNEAEAASIPVRAKLIDFGWTREAAVDANSYVLIRYPGTAKFAPPETHDKGILYRVRPQLAEIWTVAATFYYSITGEPVPIDAESHKVDLSRIESNALRNLFSKMLHEDPEQRITAADALKDDYFMQ
ncbi:kinase-like domain-containing protein [Syncephalis fuscata]|nr:kinase-like domain-containing protein [Syncephalis fuscata]